MVSAMENGEKIFGLSKEFGFDAIGITDAEPMGEDIARFKKWLAAGYNAQMGYLERSPDERGNPQLILEGAKSVIVVLQSYNIELPSQPADRPAIARYALFDDYHDFFFKRVKRFSNELRKLYEGSRTYVSVDSGKVLEKAFAMKAGLGFIGKNSALIHPRLGSRVFIGVVITTTEIAFEACAPVSDGCGECNLCVEKCPTGAIMQNRSVNASKCISYHTIENRGGIPAEIKAKLGNHVFGCDVCLNVCPYNGQAEKISGARLQFLIHPERLNYGEMLALTEKEFEKRFSQTPVKRIGYVGFMRNIIYSIDSLGLKNKYYDKLLVLAMSNNELIARSVREVLEGR